MYVILSVSDSDKHFASAIKEYSKRLWKQIFLDNIKPFRDSNRELILKKETELLINTLEKKYPNFKIFLLIKEWNILSTEELHNFISHQDCVFIIWWPYGIDRELLKKGFPKIKELSFWGITMPHGLAKLVLIEQLYRSTTLDIWKNYHY